MGENPSPSGEGCSSLETIKIKLVTINPGFSITNGIEVQEIEKPR